MVVIVKGVTSPILSARVKPGGSVPPGAVAEKNHFSTVALNLWCSKAASFRSAMSEQCNDLRADCASDDDKCDQSTILGIGVATSPLLNFCTLLDCSDKLLSDSN